MEEGLKIEAARKCIRDVVRELDAVEHCLGGLPQKRECFEGEAAGSGAAGLLTCAESSALAIGGLVRQLNLLVRQSCGQRRGELDGLPPRQNELEGLAERVATDLTDEMPAPQGYTGLLRRRARDLAMAERFLHALTRTVSDMHRAAMEGERKADHAHELGHNPRRG